MLLVAVGAVDDDTASIVKAVDDTKVDSYWLEEQKHHEEIIKKEMHILEIK